MGNYQELVKINTSAVFEGFKDDELEKNAHRFFWNVCQNGFTRFFQVVEQLNPVSLTLSAKVLHRREALENLVIQLHSQVKQGIQELDIMREETKILDRFQRQIEKNQDFEYVVQEQRVAQRNISGQGIHTTTCLNCNNTCHYGCDIPDDGNKASCIAMTDGNCHVCSGKCIWSIHKNLPYVCEIITECITKTSDELKFKYSRTLRDRNDTEKLLINLGDKFGKQQILIAEIIKTIRSHIKELEEIACSPRNLTEVDYIECLIISERQEVQPGWQERVMHLQNQKELAIKIKEAEDPKYDPFSEYKLHGDGAWITYIRQKIKSKGFHNFAK